MPAQLIPLNEASQRLEKHGISGRLFAELLVKSEPLLLGVRPGDQLHDPVDLSRVTSLQVEPGNVVVADGIRWTDVKLGWLELCAAFKRRDRLINPLYIPPEVLARSRELARITPFLGNLRPPVFSVRPVFAGSAAGTTGSAGVVCGCRIRLRRTRVGESAAGKKGPQVAETREHGCCHPQRSPGQSLHGCCLEDGNSRRRTRWPLRRESRHGAEGKIRCAAVVCRNFDFDKRQIATGVGED
jgi:hypothetical protein